MQIRLFAFATAADALGRGPGEQLLTLPTPVRTVGDLQRHLETQHPELGGMWQRLAVAVNGEVVDAARPLQDGDEVALLPPVSGGALATRGDAMGTTAPPLLTEARLEPAQLQSAVQRPGYGAVLLFVGNVRDHHEGRSVRGIHYDAYRSMAETRLGRIVVELAEQFDARLAISHRLGQVPAGEASVVIAVASAHREACYEASRAALERLKAEVPIWKKELFADGDELWREVEPLS